MRNELVVFLRIMVHVLNYAVFRNDFPTSNFTTKQKSSSKN